MREECTNNSNPEAGGIQIAKDPRVKVNYAASRVMDVKSIKAKQTLLKIDLTLSNPMSTIDKRINGFE